MCLEKLIPKWGVWGDVKACPMCLEIGLAHGPMIPHRNPLDSQVAVHLQQLMPPGDMGQELSVVTLILIDFIDINSLICLGISWKQRSYSTLCRHTFQLFCLVMGICESCFVIFFFWRRNPDTDPFDQLSPRLYLVSEYIWKRIVQCPGGSPRPDRLAEVWSKGFLCDVLGMGAIWHFGWEANGASKTQTIRDYPIDVPFSALMIWFMGAWMLSNGFTRTDWPRGSILAAASSFSEKFDHLFSHSPPWENSWPENSFGQNSRPNDLQNSALIQV